MRKSAIPLIFFVVMCSLNILLAGCGATLPKTESAQSTSSAVLDAKTANLTSSSCNSCESHQLTAVTSLAPMMASFQSNQSEFPPTMDLVDSKILTALEEQEISTSVYSRTGNQMTLTFTDSSKLVITIDDKARVKEVKKLSSNNIVLQRFTHSFGAYSAPLSVNNLQETSPAILATANYNLSQQLFSITDNVNSVTHVLPTPISPYPQLFYTTPPPEEAQPLDGLQQAPPSPALQACWDACTATYEQAKADAYSDLSIAIATALAVYIAALFLCLASAAFYPICAAGFFAAYAATIATATAAWLAAIQTADQDYENCLDQCCSTHGVPAGTWRKHLKFGQRMVLDPWITSTPTTDDLN